MATRNSGKKGMFYGRKIKSGGAGKTKRGRSKVWWETPAMRCERHHIGRCRDCSSKK